MNVPPSSSNKKDFEFFSNLGADDTMVDFAKMSILLSFEKQYDTAFKKCEIIRKKFEEKYGGSWVVGIFQNCLSDISACYEKYCLCAKYKDFYFKIFKSR